MTDPKPTLSREALLANIAYCQAKQDQHLTLLKQFELKEQEYVLLLTELRK